MTSLEIINEIIKDYEESYKNYCNRLELEEDKTVSEKESQEFAIQLSYFEKIKQDLEKYNKVMKLLKSLFKEIILEQEDIDGCSYFFMEDLRFNTFEISNELFSKLDDLKMLVGDSNE